MAPTRWREDAESTLRAAGLTLQFYSAPGSELSFRHPTGWEVEFRGDHAICRHGVPPKGFLVVYPIPNPEGGKGEGLLVAFLDEFIAPGVQGLNLVRMGPLPGNIGLLGAQFSLTLKDKPHSGIALMGIQAGIPVIVAHWIEDALFEKATAIAVAKVTLGSVEAAT